MPAAVVTGSARGIGRAIARRYANDGYDVAINYVNSEAAATEFARRLEDRTGRETVTVEADVGDPRAASRLIRRAHDAFEGVDHLVNNAGIDQHVHTAELAPADFARIVRVNLNGAFNVTKAALPRLEASTVAEGPSITNVSSVLAHTGAPIECHYAASKAGLLGLTKSHAGDFAPAIRVNAIAPGHVETDMTADRSDAEKEAERARIPMDRFGRPEEIADAAAYLRDAEWVTGETLNVNGGELMR